MDMKQWELVRLKDVVNIFDGTHQTPNYKTTGVRFISVENILNPLATQKYISEDDYKKEFKVHPEYGDVLMTMSSSFTTALAHQGEEYEPLQLTSLRQSISG